MLKEALQFLGETFSKSQGAKLLSVPGNGRKAYVDQGGTVTPYDVTPPLREHRVNSVADLIAAAEKWDTAPVVWINGDAVVLITDDADRLDSVTLRLSKSAAFAKLIALNQSPVLDQQALIRVLRIDLQGTINRADLLTAVRNIKFRVSDSGASNIQQGNESLGRTIEAEVTGAGDIPESVVVSCPVYSNPGERALTFTVGCDLEIVPADKKFRFRPIPDEIERVTDAALQGIRDRIDEALPDVATFFGSP